MNQCNRWKDNTRDPYGNGTILYLDHSNISALAVICTLIKEVTVIKETWAKNI